MLPRHVFDRLPRGQVARGAGQPQARRHRRLPLVDFKPGDAVAPRLNASYHVANRPFFDTVELKGGGDAVSAARAVLQSGEYDYAWNMQVEDDLLQRLEQGSRGRIAIFQGVNPECIQCNFSDPWRRWTGSGRA